MGKEGIYTVYLKSEDRGNIVFGFMFKDRQIRLYCEKHLASDKYMYYADYWDMIEAAELKGLYGINFWNAIPNMYKSLQLSGAERPDRDESAYETREAVRVDGLNHLFTEDNMNMKDGVLFKELADLLKELKILKEGDEVFSCTLNLSDEDKEKFDKLFGIDKLFSTDKKEETKEEKKVDNDFTDAIRQAVKKEVRRALKKDKAKDPKAFTLSLDFDEVTALYMFITKGPRQIQEYMPEKEFYAPLGRAFNKITEAWEESKKIPLREAFPNLVVPHEI